MNTLSRLWNGELTLQEAFWTWAALGGLVVNVATSALFLMLITMDRPVLAFVFGYALSLPYNALVLVGVWRAAARYSGERRWAELARIVTILGMLMLSVT